MLLKPIAIHFAWSKIGRRLYNKSIQQYSRLLAEDISSLASFSLSFQQIPSYSQYIGFLFSQIDLFSLNQPTLPHGWGTPAFLHLFNCWHVHKEDEQGLCFLLWEEENMRVKRDVGRGQEWFGSQWLLKKPLGASPGPQVFPSSSRERKWQM